MDNKQDLTISRFASFEDIITDEFDRINAEISVLNTKHKLPNQRLLNKERFVWFNDSLEKYEFYASRLWEFPFAILAANLEKGHTCADVGCGTTPFTAYLTERVGGKNVTAIDFDLIPEDKEEKHAAFGIKASYVKQIGCNFIKSSIDKINCPDNTFDRVFCISVFEHIEDPETKFRGIMELSRILKPGGLLITTFDLGINAPFTHPLDVIKFSGLKLNKHLDLEWPKERFGHYGDNSIDVFGLVLQKSTNDVYVNHRKSEMIENTKAYEQLISASLFGQLKYNQLLLARDFKNYFSAFKIFIKLILKRY